MFKVKYLFKLFLKCFNLKHLFVYGLSLLLLSSVAHCSQRRFFFVLFLPKSVEKRKKNARHKKKIELNRRPEFPPLSTNPPPLSTRGQPPAPPDAPLLTSANHESAIWPQQKKKWNQGKRCARVCTCQTSQIGIPTRQSTRPHRIIEVVIKAKQVNIERSKNRKDGRGGD